MEAINKLLSVITIDGVRELASSKVQRAWDLITKSNKDVADVQRSDNADPNNHGYLDSRWRQVAAEGSDKQMVSWEKEYQIANAKVEEMLAKMRDRVKQKHMEPVLSDEEKQELRKAIGQAKVQIDQAVAEVKANDDMVAQLIKSFAPDTVIPDGGLASLLPPIVTLPSTRATRKNTASANGERQMTSISYAEVDGNECFVTVTRNGEQVKKYHFNHIANKISNMRNASNIPANAVTGEEVEEQYFASAGVTSKRGADMELDWAFDFAKPMIVQSTNDGSTNTTDDGWKCNVKVTRSLRGMAAVAAKEAAAATESETK